MSQGSSANVQSSSAAPADGGQRAYDEHFMTQARAEAERGRGFTSPNPVVGALIVDEEDRDASGLPRVLSRGYHARLGGDHAEVAALRALPASAAALGKTLYVTLEPCNHVGRTGRCTDAVLAAGLARVVCGMPDPNPNVPGGGIDRLRQAGVAVSVGVQEAECRDQNRGFVRAHATGRPQVMLKAALSLDGRLAPAAPRATTGPVWLTGQAARTEAHRLRAQNDAILVGVGTVLADDPQLSVRLPGAPPSSASPTWPQPLRVVLDGRLRTPATAQLLGPGSLVLTSATALRECAGQAAALQARGGEVLAVPTVGDSQKLDLLAALRLLRERGVLYVLCEGGATLHGALLGAGLYDEAALFLAPLFLGEAAVPLLRGLVLADVGSSPWLADVSVQQLGPDVLLRGRLRAAPYPQTLPTPPTGAAGPTDAS
jgi:diaminohydroxyphosphoribosylaminopyrimidine deaminase/5-amino-6-(5-phosphoribosylamino)uracil reductase